jgi:hypothetical protein
MLPPVSPWPRVSRGALLLRFFAAWFLVSILFFLARLLTKTLEGRKLMNMVTKNESQTQKKIKAYSYWVNKNEKFNDCS